MMPLPKWLTIIRQILGKLTDALTAGRSAGLWTEKDTPGSASKGAPHRPGPGVGRP